MPLASRSPKRLNGHTRSESQTAVLQAACLWWFVLCSLGLLLVGLSFALPTRSRGPVANAGRRTPVSATLGPVPIKQPLTNNSTTALSSLPELRPLPRANPASPMWMPPNIAASHDNSTETVVNSSQPDPLRWRPPRLRNRRAGIKRKAD